jgi:hypothetical protein
MNTQKYYAVVCEPYDISMVPRQFCYDDDNNSVLITSNISEAKALCERLAGIHKGVDYNVVELKPLD